MLSDFLVGASAVALCVALMAGTMSLAGASEPGRLPWFLFGFAGLLLLVAFAERSPLFFGGGAGGIAATAAFIVWSARRSQRRDQEARTLAAELGLTYEHEASSTELRDLAGILTNPGDRLKVRRVLSGRWRGTEVRLFDYHYEVSGEEGATLQWTFSCALVAVPLHNDPVAITTKTLETRLMAKLGSPEIPLGDAAFDRLFDVHVHSSSTAVREILGPRALSWLTENARGLSFLVGRGRILCMAKHGTVSREDLLNLVWSFREQLSPSDSGVTGQTQVRP